MKIFTRKDKRTKLDEEIESVLEYMKNYEPDSEEYTTMSNNLERLYKSKAAGVVPERKWPVSPDTIITVVGSLLGIVLILKYEESDSITSKALGFIVKGRV